MKKIAQPPDGKRSSKANSPTGKPATARQRPDDVPRKPPPARPSVQRQAKPPTPPPTPVQKPDIHPPAASPASPPPHRPQPGIDVQLDPRITAGAMRDRSDIRMNGLASAAQPIEAISLVRNGEVLALTLYPPTAATQQVFNLNLSQHNNLDRDACTFDIVTRTRTGDESATRFAIATSPDDARVANVVQGRTQELSAGTTNLIPIVLYVEMAAVDLNNVLQVRGWCVVRTQILSIQAFTGEDQMAVARLGQTRDDIAAAYPGYGNARMSGFSIAQKLPPGDPPTSVAVEAVALCGSVSRIVVPVEYGVTLAAEPVAAVLPSPTPQVVVEIRPPPSDLHPLRHRQPHPGRRPARFRLGGLRHRHRRHHHSFG